MPSEVSSQGQLDVKPGAASFDVLGVPVSVTTLDRASAAIHAWADDGRGRFVCIRDVHGIVQAVDDPRLAALHREAAMVTPDGMPLVWIGQRAGLPVERTCGPELMDRVMAQSPASGLRHYFFGGRPGIAERLKSSFERRYPGVAVVGVETPPFRELADDELSDLAARIACSAADVVWIGLPTPRQEFLMQRLAPRTGVTLIGVGAAFDFHTGAVRRAPPWMQKSGLEFLFRLASDPRRLWRRYLIKAPRFVWMIATRRGEVM
ncbi:MAG: WecB/TagA/CpsF family glycosyltransferase [Caulobacter sp.]|nr:WecB/TagA/CpsF family glycosyltransferase [Caulobacter sp.]